MALQHARQRVRCGAEDLAHHSRARHTSSRGSFQQQVDHQRVALDLVVIEPLHPRVCPGVDPARRELLAAQTSFPGDRPSNTLLLDRLTPEALGALLALYEHKTFVYALLCGINPFDQWGVELGKSLAAKLAPVLAGGEPGDGLDASTRALAAHVRARFAPPPGRPG